MRTFSYRLQWQKMFQKIARGFMNKFHSPFLEKKWEDVMILPRIIMKSRNVDDIFKSHHWIKCRLVWPFGKNFQLLYFQMMAPFTSLPRSAFPLDILVMSGAALLTISALVVAVRDSFAKLRNYSRKRNTCALFIIFRSRLLIAGLEQFPMVLRGSESWQWPIWPPFGNMALNVIGHIGHRFLSMFFHKILAIATNSSKYESLKFASWIFQQRWM